jgi:GNAT superfamily N-acetyltransferase
VNAVTVGRVQPGAAELTDVAGVFDQYRRHYGEPVVAGQTIAWLASYISAGTLAVFTAHAGEELVGIATALALPASLRLGCSWQLRDLYVVPGARRRGAAQALVTAVRAAASAAGALRLSVQTEPGNTAALRLYRTNGFTPVEDLHILALDLQPSGG